MANTDPSEDVRGPQVSDRTRFAVLAAGEQRLLTDCIHQILAGSGFDDAGHAPIADPEALANAVGEVALRFDSQVVLLVDPLGGEWRQAAGRLRRDFPDLGLLVLTARPSYLVQRWWRQEIAGSYVASGVLSLDNTPEQVREAIDAAATCPGDSGFWLDLAKHHLAHRKTPEGERADSVRRDKDSYLTLVLEAQGLEREQIAGMTGHVETEAVRRRLDRIKQLLGAANDVQLGRLAAELGLFEDVEYY